MKTESHTSLVTVNVEQPCRRLSVSFLSCPRVPEGGLALLPRDEDRGCEQVCACPALPQALQLVP